MNHITQAQAEALAHRRATTYTHRSAPNYSSYAFVPHTLMDFVRDIEAAAAIQAHIVAQKPYCWLYNDDDMGGVQIFFVDPPQYSKPLFAAPVAPARQQRKNL